MRVEPREFGEGPTPYHTMLHHTTPRHAIPYRVVPYRCLAAVTGYSAQMDPLSDPISQTEFRQQKLLREAFELRRSARRDEDDQQKFQALHAPTREQLQEQKKKADQVAAWKRQQEYVRKRLQQRMASQL